ncbi:papilin [Trichonephila inaurata madagascariensis]|uniref:Papilin n=1 Tax=Trichonephila inaurata madagascariensis TaxID=2747483 RepID=A0A8X6XPU4_9ARAC|nr:papilin [Trichonephila inaurata madagascariensis]
MRPPAHRPTLPLRHAMVKIKILPKPSELNVRRLIFHWTPFDGICQEPMRQGGPCFSHVTMYYYDSQNKMCQEFVYTGCDGNNNRFSSKEDCERECGEVDIEDTSNDVCSLPQAEGFCNDAIWRWYYDSSVTKCKPFKYTGCSGNKNNFESYLECVIKCQKE